jgi:glucokinase
MRAHLRGRDVLRVIVCMHSAHLALAVPLMAWLGLPGYALALAASRLLGVALHTALWRQRLGLVLRADDWWRAQRAPLRAVLAIGAPGAAQNILFRACFVVGVAAVGQMGAAPLAHACLRLAAQPRRAVGGAGHRARGRDRARTPHRRRPPAGSRPAGAARVGARRAAAASLAASVPDRPVMSSRMPESVAKLQPSCWRIRVPRWQTGRLIECFVIRLQRPRNRGVSPASGFPRLLGDVGGTNARWAWQAAPGQVPTHVTTLAANEHASIGQSIAVYLERWSLPTPREAAFGIATAVTGDAVRMTNHPWTFSIDALRRELGVERLLVLNDFETLAHAVPGLGAAELCTVGGGAAVPGAALAVIGAGTGLGVSGLVADGRGGWRVVVGEGGHVTLPAGNAREASLLAVMRERFGHVSAERALSGPGLVNLYDAACRLDGEAPESIEPAQLMARSVPGTAEHSVQCEEAVRVFAALLGTVAGNLALTLGARGGVFIGGGIVPRLGARFASLPFRARFEDKGRFRSYLQAIPTWVITAESPALLGAARALDAAR